MKNKIKRINKWAKRMDKSVDDIAIQISRMEKGEKTFNIQIIDRAEKRLYKIGADLVSTGIKLMNEVR